MISPITVATEGLITRGNSPTLAIAVKGWLAILDDIVYVVRGEFYGYKNAATSILYGHSNKINNEYTGYTNINNAEVKGFGVKTNEEDFG